MKDHAQKKIEDKKEKLMMSSPPPKLERKQSIDTEPKTLLQEELKLAREEALKVLKTHPKEEALKIFLAGLNPVTSSRQAKDDIVLSDCDEE